MSKIAAAYDGASPPNLAQRDSATLADAVPLATPEGEASLAFGRFRLFPLQRRLSAGDEPIELGSRTFELLLALVEAHGNVMTKQELRTRVWPCTVVDDHNIDVHVSLLRKALGSDRDMIRTEAGRGYRFVAVVSPVPGSPPMNLPAPISQLVGRARELAELQDLVAMHRLLTLTGAGGIGKTQLGLEAARRALPRFPDGAWVVELGPLIDPELIPGAVALALGIEPGSNRSVTDQLATVLQKKHLLLVLDNCEHLIGAVARTAEALLRGVPRLHILATSQHPLAAEGEHRYGVAPLEVPPAEPGGAAQAIAHSAVQLFVERARAADPKFSWDDGTAAAVGNICRHLDGIPLAIELAAACVATMSIEVLARRLNDRFRVLRKGRHTALPQHQTLRATLDWSYGLLGEAERAVLRRIAIFAGDFTLDSAGAVAADDAIDEAQAADHVMDLVGKSLATFEIRGPASRYRLLETTRAYALEKLADSGEFDSLARRHADHYRELMERAAPLWPTAPARELVAKYAPELDNIRAALDWAFEPGGDPEAGVALAAASIPLWTLMSILGECGDIVERALSHLSLAKDTSQQIRHKMLLQAAHARSSIWAKGPVGATCSAAMRVFDLAEHLTDTEYQLRALYLLWVYRLLIGEYRTCLAVAQRLRKIAEATGNLPGIVTGARIEGASLHHLGHHRRAGTLMKRVLDSDGPSIHRSSVANFGLDQRVSALAHLARILWLQGFPDAARRMAQESTDQARLVNHANSLCVALCLGACTVAAMTGDLQATEDLASELIECAEQHGLGMRRAEGIAFRGWVAARRGNNALAAWLLRSGLYEFREMRVELRHPVLLAAFAESLVSIGRTDEGLALINDVLEESVRNEGNWCVPELLRLRGELMLRRGLPAAVAAEKDFMEALDLARRQEARSWELRAAASLARLRHSQGKASEARDVLVPVYDWFTEGFETADLKAAKELVDILHVGELDRDGKP